MTPTNNIIELRNLAKQHSAGGLNFASDIMCLCDEVEALRKDSERLDKLQELIKGPGCVSFLYVETAPTHITIIEETGRHDEFVGTGPDLRSAIDNLKDVSNGVS